MIRIEITGDSTEELRSEITRLYELLSTDHAGVQQALADRALVATKQPVTADFTLTVMAPISGAPLADLFALLESQSDGPRVEAMMWHPSDYADLRKFGRDILDIESNIEALKRGHMGKLWGASLFVHRDTPIGEVTVLADDGSISRALIRR